MRRTLWAMPLLAGVLAEPLRAEVRDASPAGFTVENAQLVAVPPEVAWDALVDDIDRWWPKDHSWWGSESTLSIAPRAGGCFCEVSGADGGRRQAQHMQVVFVEPGRLLRMTGGLGPLQGLGLDGALEFRLSPQGAGTRIVLWYRAGGYAPEDLSAFAAVVDQVQAQQLAGLASYLGDARSGVE